MGHPVGLETVRTLRHTLVISDVHLCEGVPGDDLWMRWRQNPFFPDTEFAAVVDHLLGGALDPDDRLDLVFNGDLFDFDAGRVIDGKALFEDLPRTEPIAIDLLDRILADHEGYVAALARLLRAGHRVIFVSGNHDPQLGFPGVRIRLRERLANAAGHVRFGDNVLFRTWFWQGPDGIHVEHGNQYDTYCSFRYPMAPFMPPERGHDREIHATVGSMAFRLLGSRLGFLNPHVDASFLMDLDGYLRHWFKHYMFTDHSLALTWLKGAFTIAIRVALGRDKGSPDRADQDAQAAAHETGADVDDIAQHRELFAAPAEESFHRVLREFWVDRMTLGTLSAVAVLTPAFFRNRTAVGIAIGLPLLFAAYELATPKITLDDNYRLIATRAEIIQKIYRLKAVIFGHTHVPYGRWSDGVFFGNSGTWSAAYRDLECSIPVDPRGKPVIWLRAENGRLSGGLHRWNGHALVPDFEKVAPVDHQRFSESMPPAAGEPDAVPA